MSELGIFPDSYAEAFTSMKSDCLVLHLGCGLDARYKRLQLPNTQWYDLDYPEVISIKQQLYDEETNYHYIASSVTDIQWIEAIKADEAEVLVIAEGLFMHLSETEIKALMTAQKNKFGAYTIIFDAYSKLTAKRAKNHPSLKKTGAVIQWGIDDPKDMEVYVEGAIYMKTIYLTDESVVKLLPKKHRRLFRLAGHFKSAREAHRVILMKVG